MPFEFTAGGVRAFLPTSCLMRLYRIDGDEAALHSFHAGAVSIRALPFQEGDQGSTFKDPLGLFLSAPSPFEEGDSGYHNLLTGFRLPWSNRDIPPAGSRRIRYLS